MTCHSIVGLHFAFQNRQNLYFVLDYCAGGELFFHLGKLGKFPEPRARFYAAEIILAISYVHSLDIIYRDLKPENILLRHPKKSGVKAFAIILYRAVLDLNLFIPGFVA